MCRWIAYKGKPIYLDALVAAPERSLIAQSICAAEAKVSTNGDGFGVGWYGDREVPGLYREVRPAWSDENLKSLCSQVRSSLFFAHVRASTGRRRRARTAIPSLSAVGCSCITGRSAIIARSSGASTC